ncbi:serine--tRNA ligase [Candidatus Pacearchaeota archaeon]|jgi:seryl-tRNA synthetase|nr:serine--tRNA ligase [Candidatus Pacearchaeota archaeon]|tara:strand:- start:6768 stop:8057 length:1290 start_codon:yes stop_codon:yes gene_type:complete
MIDIKLIRENSKLVKENIKKKFQNEKLPLVDKITKLDSEWRKLKYKEDNLRSERNKISQDINKARKSKDNKKSKELIKKAKEIPGKIEKIQVKTKKLYDEIKQIMQQIPNIIHKSVPTGKDEKDNKEIKKIGKPKKFDYKIKDHVEIGEKLKVLDFTRSAKVAGKGFYYLLGDLALLNQAIIRFSIDFMEKKGYTYLEPPLMLRKNILSSALDTQEFKNTIYEIKDEDLNLIGTSEYSLLGMHANETFKEKELPKKYFSYTMCFRKEIGSHGVSEKGLYRTHQFNKVEQFIFCRPEDSYKYYDEMMNNSIELFKKLEIPTRVLEMCSGDLATWKAKSADLESFRPTTKNYEEIGSLTNCTDYQARNLNIKILKQNNERVFCHTLNNTVVATSRALIAIIENNQQKDGSVKIPKVLIPYMNGKKKLDERR